MVKILNFEVVHLVEPENSRNVILIYALGENGVLYEMAGGRWISLPIGDVPTLEEIRAAAAATEQHNRKNGIS